MGLKHFVKKTVGKVFKIILAPVTWLLNALIDIPKPPHSISDKGKQYDADARINEAALGDVKTVIYGRVRDWPRYCSMPYTEFQAHDQVLNAYLYLSLGYVNVLDIKIGDTPASNFPGFESELCLPGDDMTLILPNVYTCPEVSQVELLGGLLAPADVTDGDGRTTTSVRTEDTITFDAGTSTVTFVEPILDQFSVNDVVGFRLDGTDDNEGVDFTLVSISDDWTSAVLSPAPTSVSTGGGTTFVRQRWAGPYPACPPGSTVETIALDFIIATLRKTDNEPDNSFSVTFKVQYRPIDDAGNYTGLGTWTETEITYTDSVAKVRRYTTELTLSGAMRPEVRVWRVTYESSSGTEPYPNPSQWVGLKGYIIPLDSDAPASDAESTRLAIRIRSSGLLSAQSQRTVNVLEERLLPLWDGAAFTDPQVTRNPVWAEIDWLDSQSNEAITDADQDMTEKAALADFADTNGDTFDGVFDRQVGLWEGAKTLLRVTRAKPIKDPLTGLYTVYRDEPADPVQLFCDGINSRCGTDTISLPDADTVTGVLVKFTDPLLWQQREGPLVGTDVDVREVEFMGCTTWEKAWQEAQYEYRDLYYRNHHVSLETEMEGLLPRHGKRVLVASSAKGWGHSGEVIEQAGLTIRVWPAPIWTPGMDHYVWLQESDGTPVGPINVTQGTDESYLVLETSLGITFRTGKSWKTLYAFGHDGDTGTDPDAPRVALVMERKPNGFRQATLDLLFDNAFVHEDPGPAPPDPYVLSGSIPDLTITGLTAEPIYTGVILEEDGTPLLEETGDPFLEESGTAGFSIFIDWDDVAGSTYYTLRWKKVGDPGWHVGYTGIASEATIGVPSTGDYNIHVKAYSGSYVGSESTILVTV